MRAGTQALSLLGSPRNCLILRSLAERPKRQVELRRETGFPAQSTLRGQLNSLDEAGMISKRLGDPFPTVYEYSLEQPGRELLFVIDTLERWLGACPEESFELGSEASKLAIKGLVDGWSSTVLHVLATAPHSLTELDNAIGALNYPSIERRMGAMRLAWQVEPCPNPGKVTPYDLTEWTRRAVAPLVASARWERRNLPAENAPVTALDVEAAFLLTLPLVQLPDSLSGSCRLEVRLPKTRGRAAGVLIAIEEGRMEARATAASATADCDAWAVGPPATWFDAVIEGEPDGIDTGGDESLSSALLKGLHLALFPA